MLEDPSPEKLAWAQAFTGIQIAPGLNIKPGETGGGGGGGNEDKPPKKLSAKEIRERSRQQKKGAGGEPPVKDLPAPGKEPGPAYHDPDEGHVAHPEVGEAKLPLDVILKNAGITMSEAEREAFGDWIMDRHGIGHGDHYTLKPDSLAQFKKDVEAFRSERSKKGGRGSGGAPPAASGEPHPEGEASRLDENSAEKFIKDADALGDLAKDPKIDVSAVEKQAEASEQVAETLAKELRTVPEMSGISGSSAKEFFAGIRSTFKTGAKGAAGLGLRIAIAYEVLQGVRSILQSKNIEEAVQKSFQMGGDIAKGYIEFRALQFVFKSTGVAIVVSILLDDSGGGNPLSMSGRFDLAVADVVNGMQPGSVQPAQRSSEMTNFKDPAAEETFKKTRQQAMKVLIEKIGAELTASGHEDGLTGAEAKTKFEVSQMEDEVLNITDTWMESHYNRGFRAGGGEKAAAVKRAKQAGIDAAKSGKESNFLALLEWPELEAIRQRSFDKDAQDGFDFNKTWNEYKTSYDEGYEDGRGQ
jgi:hypothetical protein